MYVYQAMEMKKQILSLKEQVLDDSKIDLDLHKYQNIIVAGMGGSGIAGMILSDLYDGLPVISVTGYQLPAFAGKSSLVIVISYSGNTEEAVSCFTQAKEKGCDSLVITSGGKLSGLSAKVIGIPKNLQPRSAIGYMLMPLLNSFLNLTPEDRKAISSRVSLVFDREPEIRAIAHRIVSERRIPVIIGSGESRSVALRWKTQFNENSKIFAYSTYLPETNHNDTVWMASSNQYPYEVLAFESTDKKINKRIELTQKLTGNKFTIIRTEGNAVERVFSLIAYGDLLSYYVAVEQNIDPEDVSVLVRLKKELA